MTHDAAVCPYCNALLPPLAAAPTGATQPCPRCGAAVPASRWRIDPAAASMREGLPPASRGPTAPGRPALGNRKTAFMLLGIMFAMALVSLSYALWTQKLRESRHPWMPKKLEPIGLRRPLELTALGYLPAGCQFIAGLHIAEMMNDEKVGKKLLAEPRPAGLDWLLKQIPRSTGLTLEEIDHAVVGVPIDAHFPQLVLVVKTLSKISLEKIAETRPTKSSLYQKQPLYEFSLKPFGEAMLWCVDDQTLIYVVRLDAPREEHLSSLATTPRAIEETQPAPLLKAMKERLPTHNFLWAVGRLDQLGAAKDALALLPNGPAALAAVKDMKTFALGLAPVEGLTLTGHFHMHNAAAAAKFKMLLEGVKIANASQKVELPPPDVPEQWLTWQVRGDVAALRELLNRGKEAKK